MKRLGLVVILSLLAVRGFAQIPEISQMMDPSRPGQTLLLSGEGFDQNTKFKLWLPMPGTAPGKEEEIYGAFGDPPGLPLTPPKEAVDLTPLVLQPQYAGLELPQTVAGFPEGRFYGPYYAVIWAGNAQGWGKPYVLNRPRVFFSWPHAAAPGEQVRLFGRNFSWWQYELDAWPGLGHAVLNRVVALRKVGGGPLIKPVQQEIYYGHRDYMVNYHTQIILPADLPEGDYEVRVHSGSGGKWGGASATSGGGETGTTGGTGGTAGGATSVTAGAGGGSGAGGGGAAAGLPRLRVWRDRRWPDRSERDDREGPRRGGREWRRRGAARSGHLLRQGRAQRAHQSRPARRGEERDDRAQRSATVYRRRDD